MVKALWAGPLSRDRVGTSAMVSAPECCVNKEGGSEVSNHTYYQLTHLTSSESDIEW